MADSDPVELEIILNPDTEDFEEGLELIGDKVDEIADEAMKKMEESLKRQRVELELINKLLDPTALKERVRLEREIEEGKKRVREAEGKERREQERPGFFQKLFQNPKGMFDDVIKGSKGLWGGIKEEFKKGGIGGLMDMGFGALKGAGGGGAGGAAGGGISQLLGAMGGAKAGSLGAMGGAAAGAMGGPIGIAVAAGMEAVSKIGTVMGAAAGVAVKGLSGVASGLRELGGTLGPIGLGFAALSAGAKGLADAVSSIPILGDLFGPMLSALAVVPGLLQDITTTLVGFAAKASPGAFQVFQFAVEDAQAVIGRAFVPMLQIMTQVVRLFGDVLASILPDFNEASGALSGLREAMAEMGVGVRDAMKEIGPVIREVFIGAMQRLGSILSEMSPYIQDVVKLWGAFIEIGKAGGTFSMLWTAMTWQFRVLWNVMTGLVHVFSVMTIAVRDFLVSIGLISRPAADAAARSSTGAAARQASYSSFQDFARSLQTAAFSQPGMTPAEEAQVQVPGLLTSVVDAINQLPVDISNAVAAGAAQIATNPAGAAQDAAAGAAGVVSPGAGAYVHLGAYAVRRLGRAFGLGGEE